MSKLEVRRCKCKTAGYTLCDAPWMVLDAGWISRSYATHAEAIAYADRLANPTPPSLSAHGARLTDDAARDFREGL